MSLGRPPRALTVARVQAIEISLDWRWAPVLGLATWLLAHAVLPARFPTWDWSTTWLLAAAAVVSGEFALLLHEISHAWLAHSHGHRVRKIVFHGLHARTVLESIEVLDGEAVIALVGPLVNVVLAAFAECLRLAFVTEGPLDVFLLMLMVGNAAAAVLSLLPLGGSDGARALSGLRRRLG